LTSDDQFPDVTRAFKKQRSNDVALCCPRCGTEAGIHFGKPSVIPGTQGEPERDGQLVIPVWGDGCGHKTHLVMTFHGGMVGIDARDGPYTPAF